MTQEQLSIKVAEHEVKVKALEHRMKDVEDKQESINALAISVNELATNMRYMVEEQRSQGDRLKQLEVEPAESAKHYRRLIIGSILTAIAGLVIGALGALLFK